MGRLASGAGERVSASRLTVGDCLSVFGAEPPESFDSLVQDWPAGVSFMGRGWDGDHGGRDAWVAYWRARAAAGLRIVKPGAFSLTWALPRTQHWTALALEDAGWEIRDTIHHTFGTGWPKSGGQLKPAHEVWILARRPLGRGLTVAENVERWGVGELFVDACRVARGAPIAAHHGTDATYGRGFSAPYQPGDAGKSLNHEGSFPPNAIFSHSSVCEATGTRVVLPGGQHRFRTEFDHARGGSIFEHSRFTNRTNIASPDGTESIPSFDCLASCPCGASTLAPSGGAAPRCEACGEGMRWCCAVAALDAESGAAGMHSAGAASEGRRYKREAAENVYGTSLYGSGLRHGDTERGSAASRFYPCFTYQAKPATSERDAGLDAFFWRRAPRHPFGFERVDRATFDALPPVDRAQGNVHPTVKGIRLLEWLQRLITPPGGRTADGTAGSGGTAIAAARQGFDYLGCDLSPEAIEIARARLAFWRAVPSTATIATLRRPTRRAPAQPSLFDAPHTREEASAAE